MTRGSSADHELRRTSYRLGLQTGLLVVGVLAVVGLVLFVVYVRSSAHATDELLRNATAVDAVADAPRGVDLVIVTPRGRVSTRALPDGLPDEQALAAVARDGLTRQTEVDRGERRFTVRTAQHEGRVVQAAVDGEEGAEARRRIVTSLLVAGLVGVALSALVATWMARRAVSPLAQSLTMQRRFVADASHELRTPLTLLSTRVQMVARRARTSGTGPTGHDLDGVIADTDRLTGILDDLLIAADTRTSSDQRPLDVAGLVRECVASAAGAAEAAGVRLVVHADSTVVVDAVEASLRRAVTALVDNALDHAESVVDVRVGDGRRHVRIAVADDGPGIPDEVAPHVFERFTSSRSGAEPLGSRRHYGIGLALVADVAVAHGGTVTAGAHEDGARGAVLTLTLPHRRPRGRRVT